MAKKQFKAESKRLLDLMQCFKQSAVFVKKLKIITPNVKIVCFLISATLIKSSQRNDT